MSFLTSDDVRIWYEHTPGEQTLVFLHGWVENADIWDEIISEFPEHGILKIDLRGHARSEETHNTHSLERMAQDVHELITQLNITHPVLIGHSMGGMISQILLTQGYKKAVLVNTAAHNPISASITGFIQRTESLLKESYADAEVLPYTKQTTPYTARECIKAIEHFDIRNHIADVHAHVCIIGSRYDALTPLRFSRELHELITHSELHVLDAGHITPLTHPKEISSILIEFL